MLIGVDGWRGPGGLVLAISFYDSMELWNGLPREEVVAGTIIIYKIYLTGTGIGKFRRDMGQVLAKGTRLDGAAWFAWTIWVKGTVSVLYDYKLALRSHCYFLGVFMNCL